MNVGQLLSVVIAAALPPAAAWAEPTFDVFQEICVKPDSTAAALAVADAKGWKPIPKAQLAAFPTFVKGATRPVVDGRMDGTLGSATTLKWAMIVGHADRIDKDVPVGVDFCVIASSTVDAEGLEADMARHAGVVRSSGLFDDDKTIAFVWRDGPDGRKPVTKAEFESTDVLGAKVLVAQVQNNFGMVGLLTPTK